MKLHPNDLDEESVFAVRRRWLTGVGVSPRVFGTVDHSEAHRTLDRAEEVRA